MLYMRMARARIYTEGPGRGLPVSAPLCDALATENNQGSQSLCVSQAVIGFFGMSVNMAGDWVGAGISGNISLIGRAALTGLAGPPC